ncbi:hypothetical protein MGLY_20430 [Neomoorella glycerini]|uniref:Uncharacterized protein n=1 Tax=Neomoorella glycerini TaxID=55779 RepID=A0A6I5ZST6_9FIRM|nr:hypothetical protein MGLY_20430 [Moorella glycerini]
MGQPQRLFLEYVRYLRAEAAAVAHRLAHALPCLQGDNDADIPYPGLDDLLDDEKQNGPVATGMSCLVVVYVSGRRRVPLPPERMRPFMV